jgi:hypothetical protein
LEVRNNKLTLQDVVDVEDSVVATLVVLIVVADAVISVIAALAPAVAHVKATRETTTSATPTTPVEKGHYAMSVSRKVMLHLCDGAGLMRTMSLTRSSLLLRPTPTTLTPTGTPTRELRIM